eukprot:141202-Pleurochrysis_carterae.AAC.1
MATLWSVRTGLELLDEKLTHWSESSLTKQDGSILLGYDCEGNVRVADKGKDEIDVNFAKQACLTRFPQTAQITICTPHVHSRLVRTMRVDDRTSNQGLDRLRST